MPKVRSRRWLRRAGIAAGVCALALALLACAAVLLLRHRMAATEAPLDGTLRAGGLGAPVTVRRDGHGVPHIEAASLDDLLFAQGWVTASDRLWQMDMARRLPAGEAAEVLGSAALEHDRLERTLGVRDAAARMVGSLPPEQLKQLNAYARGVNAFLARGSLPAEFTLLAYKPAPWRPVDSVLVALSMAELLDQRWQTKLKHEQVEARLRARGDGDLLADLYPVGSWRDHPPVPSGPAIGDPQDVPQIPLDSTQTRAWPAPALWALSGLGNDTARPGSNNWAVSGAHTASGKPLLANDMHLGHAIPDLWYEAELRAGAFHAAGITVPGLPFIAAGHNDHIAWGFTALGGDVQDIYVEQTNVFGQYRIASPSGDPVRFEPMQHEGERIRVRGGADVDLDVERTAHGPVITPIVPGERRTLTLHWNIQDDAAHGLPLYALDTAADWPSFRAALATWWAPTLNVVYADDAGHIGYQAAGLIPLRAGGLQGVPIVHQLAPEMKTAVGEWTGYIPFDALPSALDPEGGVVATANSRVSPDNYPYQLTLDWASPYRNERIWRTLAGKRGLTPKDMLTLQTDVYSEADQEFAQHLAYAVDHAQNPSARAREAADLLRSWDGMLGVDSAPAAIVTTTEQRFWPAVLGPKIGDGAALYDWAESAYAREQMVAGAPARWLPPGAHSWNDLLAGLLDASLENAPKQLRDWRYGAVHTLAMDHPLWRLLPGMHTGIGPVPQSGSPTTVKQVSGELGPSQRFIADLADWDRSTENIVMGESGDPRSPYYRDQWSSWYGGSTFALPFSPGAVQAAAQHTLQLLP